MKDLRTSHYEAEVEINRLNAKNSELIAVLEKIASLRDSNTSAASIAQSALDTMKALRDIRHSE